MDNKVNFTKNGKRVGAMSLKSSDQDTAQLYFYGDICSERWQSALFEEDKCPQDIVNFLALLDEFQNLEIYINSGGGSVFAGIAIYNKLKRHKGKKTVYIDGIAASIASVIAFAGDEIFCPANAEIMIHKPWTDCVGNADELRKIADRLDVAQESIVTTYMQYVKDGVTEEQINELVNEETWLTGAKAAEIFKTITVTETFSMAACADSTFFEKYKNTPDTVKNRNNVVDKKEVERLRLELELVCL